MEWTPPSAHDWRTTDTDEINKRRQRAREESFVITNLVAEDTIEHRMLDTLANKQALADGVLDLRGDLSNIKMGGGRQAFLEKLNQLMGPTAAERQATSGTTHARPPLPADRGLAFSRLARQLVNGALVRCEEQYPNDGPHSVLLVVVRRCGWRSLIVPPTRRCGAWLTRD